MNHVPHSRVLLALGLALLLAAGQSCGYATVAAASSVGEDPTDSNGAPVLNTFTLEDPRESPATISLVLTDNEADPALVRFYYRLPGLEPLEMTQLSQARGYPAEIQGNTATLQSSPAGIVQKVTWDFAAEPTLPDSGYVAGVSIYALVNNGINSVTPGINEEEVGLGNDPPEIHQPQAPVGESTGDVAVTFGIVDSSSDAVELEIMYSSEGGAKSPVWLPATTLGKTVNLASSPDGTGAAHQITWRTDLDLPESDVMARVRLRADDGLESSLWVEIDQELHVDNNEPAVALLDVDALFVGPDRARGVPIPVDVLDQEGDSSRLVIQWRRAGEEYPEFELTTPQKLEEALADPAQRARLHLCTEQPTVHEGVLALLPSDLPDASRMVRLPELASASSSLVPGGLAGQFIEVLRPTSKPVAIGWSSELASVKSTLPIGDGTRVLVLGSSEAGWAVQERDLATGEIFGTLPLSGDEFIPVTMALDPRQEFLFIAFTRQNGGTTLTKVLRIERDDPSNLLVYFTAQTGPSFAIREIAAPTRYTAVVTSSNGTSIYSYVESSGTTLGEVFLADLQSGGESIDTWGVVADPRDPDQVYFSNPLLDAVYALNTSTRQFEELPVEAPPELGTPLPLPRSMAFEADGARLLVTTEDSSGNVSIRALNVREQYDVTPGSGDGPDPIVVEVLSGLQDSRAQFSTGPDNLRIVTSEKLGQVNVSGGLEQIRQVVNLPTSSGDPLPYDPARQIVTLSESLSPLPLPGSHWRIRAEQAFTSSSQEGERAIFVWNVGDVPQGGIVFLRAMAVDNDLGSFAPFEAAKELRSPFGGDPILLGVDGATGTDPRDCVVVDLNNDGNRDIVVTQNGRVVAFMQSEPGQFDPRPVVIASGPDLRPVAVASADFDEDGFADIAIANATTNQVEIYISDTGLSFQLQASLGSSGIAEISDMHIRQFGGLFVTHKVIVADQTSGRLFLFRQVFPGALNFTEEASLDVQLVPSVTASKVDNGESLDLVTASPLAGGVTIFYQLFDGTFNSGEDIFVPGLSAPRAVHVADLSRNNLVEIIVTSDLGDRLFLVPQEPDDQFGNHVFGTHQEIGGPGITEGPVALTTADLDGDGDLDLVCANSSGDNLTVFFQNAAGELDQLPLVLGNTSTMNSPSTVLAADINKDGLTDLLTANQLGGNLTLHLQRPRVSLDSPPVQLILDGPSGFGADPVAIASGDLDKDGDLDLVCANRSDGSLSILRQLQPGIFEPLPSLIGDGNAYSSVAVADVSGDGLPDIIAGNDDSKVIELFLQNPSGGFGADSAADVVLGARETCDPRSLVVADLNGDGRLDIACAGPETPIFMQPAGGFLTEETPTTELGFGSETVAARDVDSDGWVDLVTGAGNLIVHFQTPERGFGQARAEVSKGGSVAPNSILSKDLNQDGLQDLAVAVRGTNELVVFFQTEPRVFSSSPVVLSREGGPTGPQTIVAADLDNDGLPELIAANADSSDLTIFFQVLPGTFVPAPLVRGGPGTTDNVYSLVAADLDGDSDVDVATVNPGAFGTQTSDSITVFWGGH